MKSVLILIAVHSVAAQAPPTFPAQYSCKKTYTLNGTAYPSTSHIDSTNLQKVDQKATSKLVSFYANKTKYSQTSGWCSKLTIYDHFSGDPPMAAAYKFMGTEAVGGVECDKFGEDDQWAHHVVYFKKGTWLPVQVYDKQQEDTGMLNGMTHYLQCKEGKDASAYALTAQCFQ
jgi:hypothetical protein